MRFCKCKTILGECPCMWENIHIKEETCTLLIITWFDGRNCTTLVLKLLTAKKASLFQSCVLLLSCKLYYFHLKLVCYFYQIFIFSPNDSPSKTRCFLFHLKSSFRSQDNQNFVNFPLSFQTFQIQKNKWNRNNLWCHELACMNLQM